MDTLITSADKIISFIPQRPPMVMVDTLYSADIESVKITSGLTVTPENIFCTNGIFSISGIIEHVAQTAALMAGYMGSLKSDNARVRTGFIGALKNCVFTAAAKEGDQLVTSLETTHQFDNVSIVKAVVRCGSREIASAEMQIFEVDE